MIPMKSHFESTVFPPFEIFKFTFHYEKMLLNLPIGFGAVTVFDRKTRLRALRSSLVSSHSLLILFLFD